MDHASGPVSPPEAEVVQVSDAIWQRTDRRWGSSRENAARIAWSAQSG
jgi:hypothetical protein